MTELTATFSLQFPLQAQPDDLAHFERSGKHYPHLLKEGDPIRTRMITERAIIRAAATGLLAMEPECKVSVGYDRDDHIEGCSPTRDLGTIMEAIGACDDEWLNLFDKDGCHLGQVYLVYGNDGYDVICDYHINLEPGLKDANALSDMIGDAAEHHA